MRTVLLRISLVLFATLTLLTAGVALWHDHELAQSKQVIRYLSKKTQNDAKRLLDLRSEKFKMFVGDFTLWDELFNFHQKPDPKWAHGSLMTALTECKADSYTVFDRSGKVLYSESTSAVDGKKLIPSYKSWKDLFASGSGIRRVFLKTESGIAEVHLATIHRTLDHDRKGPYTGYMAIVKLWKQSYVDDLGTWIGAKALIKNQPSDETSDEDSYRFSLPLAGSNDQPIAYICFNVLDATIATTNSSTWRLTKWFTAFSLFLYACLVAFLIVLVCKPLKLISHALVTGNSKPLESLSKATTEFGQIAILVKEAIDHRFELKKQAGELQQRVIEQKFELDEQQYRDKLTLLYNRAYFNERFTKLVESSRGFRHLTVILMDLDNFQLINDSLDMKAGDDLLQQVAQRLKSVVPPHGIAVRFGGDEFAVILPSLTEINEFPNLLEQIQALFAQPFDLSGMTTYISVAMGVSSYPIEELSKSGHDMLKQADLALHHAKTLGKGRHACYEQSMLDHAENRIYAESGLRMAIENDEFKVVYHPIVDIDTGELHAVEALVRWEHPSRGLVPPSEFIPLAEQSGLIIPLGYNILRKACNEIGRLWATHPETPRFLLSVNLSGKQLDETDTTQRVIEILRETDFPPKHLQIEVTETVMAYDLTESIKRLSEIRSLGVSIAIDDFGTGYSSISTLGDLPADNIKVDMCFVKRLPDDIESISILRAISAMAATVGLETVAEGIENRDQLELLAILGFNYCQGYLFSKPLPFHELEALVIETPTALVDRLHVARAADNLEAA